MKTKTLCKEIAKILNKKILQFEEQIIYIDNEKRKKIILTTYVWQRAMRTSKHLFRR